MCAAVTSSSSLAAAVNGTASSSRRTSLESVASVGSTATSVDSGSGVPKARKSFKPSKIAVHCLVSEAQLLDN